MDNICPIHNVIMTEKQGKFGIFCSHKDGENWCNGKPKDYKATWESRKKDFLDAVEPTKAPEKPEVDWDAISGKVRHGVVVAVIEHGGLEALKGQIAKINKVVDYIMTGETEAE